MKISCQSCGTRYTIADDKVMGEGRVFKVHCKQCSGTIMVNGLSESPDATEAAAPRDPEPWYYAVGQDRQGPISLDELAPLIANGTVSADTYMWQNGMGDWSVFTDVPELQSLLSSLPEAVQSRASSAPAVVAKSPKSQPQRADTGEDIFSFDTGEKGSRNAVHGRRDSSVLFSLDELSSFTDPPAADPQAFLTDSSGLIDIRGLANSYKAQADDTDNPFLSATAGLSSSPNRPSFSLSHVPVVARRRSSMPWILGIAAVVVVGTGVALAVTLGGDKETTPPPRPPATAEKEPRKLKKKRKQLAVAASPSAKAEDGAAKTERVDEVEAEIKDPALNIEAPKVAKKDTSPTKTDVKPKNNGRKIPTKVVRKVVKKTLPKAVAATPKQPEKKVPAVAVKPSSVDSKANSKGVNDLLSSLSGTKTKTEGGGKANVATGPRTLTSATVRSKVGAKKGRFKTCYLMQPNRVPGGVNLKLSFTIQSNGSVSNARVLGGGLSGSVQSCIRRALKSTRFPSFRDPVKKVNYPLFLN